MRLGSHRRSSVTRGSQDESRPDGSPGDDETVVEPDQGNGADLSRVTLPTFILEPRSMLERITKYGFQAGIIRWNILVLTAKFSAYASLLIPFTLLRGVKKPLNPILGETFSCYWDYPDGTRGYYISEQTSHHPPKSSYFFLAPEHDIRIDGTLKPRSKFLGNSAASMMEGIAILRFMNRGTSKGGEKYFLTQPNMYARGILFGKMKYELGDHSFVKCPELHLTADIEFKTKGYFGGTYNAIGGTIKNELTGETLYELSGMWSGEMVVKNLTNGHKELLFNATNAKATPPISRPIQEQTERESQKLWYNTVAAIKETNHVAATDEKTKIEDRQREEAAQRAAEGTEWQPSLFRKVRGGPGGPEEGEEDLDWILDADIDGKTPDAKAQQILSIIPILPGQPNSSKPPQKASQASEAPQVQTATNDLIDFGNSEPQATVNNMPPAHESAKASGKEEEPSKPIRRQSTQTSLVDEFVDANDGTGESLI
ncbi:Oxysterol-binding protein- protein 8 [Agyrium rufum]|nr:Oxysterol-binding protein- protein 8 [Agyrium rufum]